MKMIVRHVQRFTTLLPHVSEESSSMFCTDELSYAGTTAFDQDADVRRPQVTMTADKTQSGLLYISNSPYYG